MLTNATLDWLLDSPNPSLHYFVYRHLLSRPDHAPEVRSARHALMTQGLVPAVFARQTATGQWAGEHSYYTPKYVSTHWSLLLLTELGVDPADDRFQAGLEYMLAATADRLQASLANDEHGFSCLWGNILRYMAYGGRTDDARVQSMLVYIQRDLDRGNCACGINGGYSCVWGIVRCLWGISALTQSERARLQPVVDQALGFLLDEYHLAEVNYPMPENAKVHSLWSKLSFPLFYQVDILFTLRVLADLNALHQPQVQGALDWLETRRQPNGHWSASSPYRQITWHLDGDAGDTKRWITAHALDVLQKAGRV